MAARRLCRALALAAPFRASPSPLPLAASGARAPVAGTLLPLSVPRGPLPRFFSGIRGIRRGRRRHTVAATKQEGVGNISAPSPSAEEREVELSARIDIEGADDHEVQCIAELLKLNAPMAMKSALEALSNLKSRTRYISIGDVVKYEKIELSVMLCNDDFIRTLNREWRGDDQAVDLLAMSQYIPNINNPSLILGQIVISVDIAARQAKDRGHKLLDEVRILMVDGLLRLLCFNDEHSSEAMKEMVEMQHLVLKDLGWYRTGITSQTATCFG